MFNNVKKEKIKNCIIIGSGPAGYSAAIYASRADLNPVLYTGLDVGGQLINTTYIENYPGFPNKITGKELMENFKKQAESFNAKIIFKYVKKVVLSNLKNSDTGKDIHYIHLNDNTIIKTIGLIIATGSYPKYLGLKNEKKLIGYGISFCAICDGFFYKKKDIAIVGGGDTALEEANYLAKICNKVYLLVRSNSFKASKIMQKRILTTKNIIILYNHKIIKIVGEKKLEHIIILDILNNNKKILNIHGLFIAIGHYPNTKLFNKQLNLDNNGYIITYNNNTSTNKPGVFASGEVVDSRYRQAITSASMGCMAAIDLERYLNNL